MKKLKFTKIIASLLVIVSAMAVNPIGGNAQWKQDSNGWWNTEGNSYSIGWKDINGKWYYFGQDGYMVHDTIISGYKIGAYGAWIQAEQNDVQTSGNDRKATNNDDINFSVDQLVSIIKSKFNNVEVKDVEEDFLPTTRKLINIADERLTVYIYNSNEKMEKDATNLIKNYCSYYKTLANGEVEIISPNWSYAPHFYKKGKIIVQYCGENKTIISYLSSSLGEQFEGTNKG